MPELKENNDYFPLVILAKSGANGISGINGFGPFPGIDITVVTDKNCNIAHVDDDKRQEKQHLLNDAVEKLNKMGIATKLVNRVHSKIVIEDEELLCVGSLTGSVLHGKISINDTIRLWCTVAKA